MTPAQAYTVNAETVNFTTHLPPKNVTRRMLRKELRRAGVLRSGKSVDLFNDQGQRTPQMTDLPVHRPDVVVGVDERVGRVTGLQERVDFVPETVSHKDHPSVEKSTAATVPLTSSTLGEPVDAPKPSGRRVDSTIHGLPIPYYQDELVTLYQGDSLELADHWNHGDVLITDPPYGLQALAGAYGTSHRTIANDMDTTVRDRVLEIWGTRPAAVFGSPRLEDPPGSWTDRLVWDKGQLGLNGGPWRYAHETIFVRGDGWVRVDNTASSILRHTSQSNRKHVQDHIHSKPMQLLASLMMSAPPGIIVDPFAGGGSAVVAASLLGRQIIAVELELGNCQTIVKRLRQQSFDLGAL